MLDRKLNLNRSLKLVWSLKLLLIATIICAFFLPFPVFAARAHPEWWYVNQWCKPHAGNSVAVLNDGTKCDCMTDDYVVEVEYANKWKNAIGKVLHYSLQTGKRSLIVLILESPRDEIYHNQLKTLISYFRLPVDIWKIGAAAEINNEKTPKK